MLRSLLFRCLVALLALVLVGGNVHAGMHLIASGPSSPYTQQLASAASSHDQDPEQDKGVGCCRDCIGCVSANTLMPDLNGVVPAIFGATIRYTRHQPFLPGRALLPEPEPPRPSALI
jgi:hypothetical protein